MKGKNKKSNDNNPARVPEVNGQILNNEVLESSEGTPTNDFMETPVAEKQKGVTLNDLAEIDPELLTGKSSDAVKAPDLPSLPEKKGAKAEEPAAVTRDIPTEINLCSIRRYPGAHYRCIVIRPRHRHGRVFYKPSHHQRQRYLQRRVQLHVPL